MNKLQNDIRQLTDTIENVSNKPLLRDTIELNLRKLGHEDEEAIKVELDKLFNVTVH